MLRTPERERQKLIVSKLDALCQKLDDSYNLNSGGCCYVAYCLAKVLRRVKIPYNLVIFQNSEDIDFHNYKEDLMERKPLYTYSHYAIEVPDIGTINVEERHKLRVSLTISNLLPKDIYYIYKTGDWNTYYNHSDSNKIIRKSIENALQELQT